MRSALRIVAAVVSLVGAPGIEHGLLDVKVIAFSGGPERSPARHPGRTAVSGRHPRGIAP